MIIKSKISPPIPHFTAIQRHTITQALDHYQDFRALFFSAPAGYGKTTAVWQWLENQDKVYCWLSLDDYDNDCKRFVDYLIHCIAQMFHGFGNNLLTQTTQVPDDNFCRIIDQIIDVIADNVALDKEYWIVIDDFHRITNEHIQNYIQRMIHFLPTNVRLIIATRRRIPAHMHDNIVYGKVKTITQRELAFSSADVRKLLATSNTTLNEEEAANAITRKAEGWPTGIQLIIRNVEQSNLKDLDWQQQKEASLHLLFESLFHSLPTALQNFLLDVGTQPRFNEGLAKHVQQEHFCPETIQQVITENLFIVSSQDDVSWYRLHDLFRSYLQKKAHSLNPEVYLKNQIRVAEYYSKLEMADEAINTLLANQCWEKALELIASHGVSYYRTGRSTQLYQWLLQIPRHLIEERPRIVSLLITVIPDQQKPNQAAPYIQTLQPRLEQVISGQQPLSSLGVEDTMELAEMVLEVGYYAGYIHRVNNALETALDNDLELLKRVDSFDLPIRARVLLGIASDYYALGRISAAWPYLQQAMTFARNEDELYILVFSFTFFALAGVYKGETDAVLLAYAECKQWVADHHYQQLPVTVWLDGCMIEVYRERHELEKARVLVPAVVNYLKTDPPFIQKVLGFNVLERFFASAPDFRHPDLPEQQHTQLPADILRRFSFSFHSAAGLQARAALNRSDLQTAQQWAQSHRQIAQDPEFGLEKDRIVLSKTLLLSGQFDAARDILLDVQKEATAGGRCLHVTSCELLLAQIAERQHQQTLAQNHFTQALTLGARHHFLQTFIEEGTAIIPFLKRAIKQPIEPVFCRKLLKLMDAKPSQTATHSVYTENLTLREQEIMQLIDQGMSNKEIAAHSNIKLSTVKTHLVNICQKLGV